MRNYLLTKALAQSFMIFAHFITLLPRQGAENETKCGRALGGQLQHGIVMGTAIADCACSDGLGINRRRGVSIGIVAKAIHPISGFFCFVWIASLRRNRGA